MLKNLVYLISCVLISWQQELNVRAFPRFPRKNSWNSSILRTPDWQNDDDSVDRQDFHCDFDPQHPHDGRRKRTLACYLLISTWTPKHMHYSKHTKVNKCNKNLRTNKIVQCIKAVAAKTHSLSWVLRTNTVNGKNNTSWRLSSDFHTHCGTHAQTHK